MKIKVGQKCKITKSIFDYTFDIPENTVVEICEVLNLSIFPFPYRAKIQVNNEVETISI